MEQLPKQSRFENAKLVESFREDFALKVEEMITDPKHSESILIVALGQNYKNLPDQIRQAKKKFSINTWEGDAFARVLEKYRPINPEDYEKLRSILFKD